ncbi:alpha/beta fold hydrolase [Natronosalvus vescus]|uniref:alpha/beta fold hydrolase n=1 Tax=Natronosalvus vescus TaxID=2953881 RepID=UPI002090C607|nr:alpha/beta fold hydrolase [Natronosalvus vescus]
MKLRTLLGATVGVIGGVVLGNRALRTRAGSLDNPFAGVERTYRWRGMDVTYTVSGEPDAPDVVLVHSIHAGASGHEFSRIVEDLAESYRVTVIDLPGFGRSDRPPLVYSPGLYAEFLQDITRDTTDEPIVIASSLSGAFAVEAAGDSEWERLVLICPLTDTGARRPWMRTVLRTPILGTTLFNILASKPSIRYFYERDGYYDPSRIDREAIEYAWKSAHQPGGRYAPASFVAGTLDPDIDLATELAALEVPTTLIWGRDAKLVPLRDGRELADAADLDLVVVDYATQLPHAEHPERFLEYVEAELPRADS